MRLAAMGCGPARQTDGPFCTDPVPHARSMFGRNGDEALVPVPSQVSLCQLPLPVIGACTWSAGFGPILAAMADFDRYRTTPASSSSSVSRSVRMQCNATPRGASLHTKALGGAGLGRESAFDAGFCRGSFRAAGRPRVVRKRLVNWRDARALFQHWVDLHWFKTN